MQRDAAIHQLFFWDLSFEGDPEPAPSLGQGWRTRQPPQMFPWLGHSPHTRIFNSCCISGFWNEMCWLPLKQLHAGSQRVALLLRDALRMGFTPSLPLCRWGQPGCASVSPALNRGNCCFCGSAPISSKEGKRREGKIMWQTEEGWADSLAGRRAARQSSRLARCAPHPWLAPPFPLAASPVLSGSSWPTGGGWQGRQQPLGTHARQGAHRWSPGGKDNLRCFYQKMF